VTTLPKCYLAYSHADTDEAMSFVEAFDPKHDFLRFQSEHRIDQDIENCFGRTELLKKLREKWLGDTAVTILLIGNASPASAEYLDLEIAASLYEDKSYGRNGLVGITLPSAASSSQNYVPPRFADNWAHGTGYARWYKYPESLAALQPMIADAMDARTTRAEFVNNQRALLESRPNFPRKAPVTECPDCPKSPLDQSY